MHDLYLELGLTAKHFMDEGKLVPDDIITCIVNERLKKYKEDSWLVDGENSVNMNLLSLIYF